MRDDEEVIFNGPSLNTVKREKSKERNSKKLSSIRDAASIKGRMISVKRFTEKVVESDSDTSSKIASENQSLKQEVKELKGLVKTLIHSVADMK